MKKLLSSLLIALLLGTFLAPGVPVFAAGFTLVNDTSQIGSNGGGNFVLINIAIPTVTAGNMLVLTSSMCATISSITGGGVTWQVAKAINGANGDTEVWYGLNSSGATSPTIAVNQGGCGSVTVQMNVQEFSLPGGTSGVTIEAGTAGSNSASGADGGTIVSGTITPTAGRNAVMFVTWARNTTQTRVSGPTGGFSYDAGNPVSPGTGNNSYQIVTGTSGSYSLSEVYNNINGSSNAIIVALSVSGVAPAVPATSQLSLWATLKVWGYLRI